MADSTAVLDGAMQTAFKHRLIEAAEAQVDIAEAGQGATLMYIGSQDDPLARMFSAAFHVFAFAPDTEFDVLTPAMKARRLAAIAESLGIEQCSLCAQGDNCAALLHLAADEPEKFINNVMIAPGVYDERGVLRDPTLADKLAAMTGHNLALFGTDAGGNVQGSPSCYRLNIANCHLMYVYDAIDPARDRPDAAAEVIIDFLNRGDGFLVSEQDGRIHP